MDESEVELEQVIASLLSGMKIIKKLESLFSVACMILA